jgi:hypothetical protein
MQRRDRECLADHATRHHAVADELAMEDFDRDRPAKRLMLAGVDGAHSARADRLENAVPPEGREALHDTMRLQGVFRLQLAEATRAKRA